MVDARHSWLLAVAVIGIYQSSLSLLGLSQYILGADTDRSVGLVAANREGLCSCCGFLALYLAGVQLGRLLLRRQRLVAPHHSSASPSS